MEATAANPVSSVIVTGGASGIGRAVTEMVLQRGGCVGVLDLDLARLGDLSQSFPGRLAALQGSALDEDFLHTAWTHFSSALPVPVNGLVNCAGLPPVPRAAAPTAPSERQLARIAAQWYDRCATPIALCRRA